MGDGGHNTSESLENGDHPLRITWSPLGKNSCGWPTISGAEAWVVLSRGRRTGQGKFVCSLKLTAILAQVYQEVDTSSIFHWPGWQSPYPNHSEQAGARSVPSGKLLSIFESEFLPCKIRMLVLALVVVRVFHTVGLVWNISLLISISCRRLKGDITQEWTNWPFAWIDFVGGKIKRDTPNENLELFIESLQRHWI